MDLAGQMWQTPAADSFRSRGGDRKDEMGLDQQARLTWPTPASRDHKGSSPASVTRVNGKSRLDLLDHAAEQGFSRPHPETAGRGPRSWRDRVMITRLLWAWMKSSYGRSVAMRLFRKRHTRRLNPLFVEWLMGWPPGHALCDCSATEFVHWKRDMRGALSALPMASGPWIWSGNDSEQIASQTDLFSDV